MPEDAGRTLVSRSRHYLLGNRGCLYNAAMPELPEVETTRQTLLAALDRRVEQVTLRTPDYVTGKKQPADLLVGCRLLALERRGKQLILAGRRRAGEAIAALGLHLGMSGSLGLVAGDSPLLERKHVHLIWHLEKNVCLLFHDPRRFGGVWTFENLEAARQARFGRLGPDALDITPRQLHAGLRRTRRCLKAALLDQHLVAGLGNIYVDESLFRASLSPRIMACRLTLVECERLCGRFHQVLTEALENGGSTLRDYVNANHDPGRFQRQWRVYGRSGSPCVVCGSLLRKIQLAGRTTVYCSRCQKAPWKSILK